VVVLTDSGLRSRGKPAASRESLVAQRLALIAFGCLAARRWLGVSRDEGLRVGLLDEELVLDVVHVHFDVVAGDLLGPLVLEVKVLVLSDLLAARLFSLLHVLWKFKSTYFGGGAHSAWALVLNAFEPGLEPLVEHPVLLLEFYGGQILLVGLLLVVKGKKQSLVVKLSKVGRVRVHRHRGVRVLWPHADWLLRVDHLLIFRLGLVAEGNL
jgi:hypothetical protein